MPRKLHNSAVELSISLFRRKRKRSNTGSRSSAGVKSFSIVGRRYSAGSSRRFSPFFSDRFERRGLVYVGADINNPAQTQATNGSGYWQSHGSADWEPTLSVANGQPISQTDALNNTTSYTYNSYGKVLTVTDAESNVTSYTYNLLGQMTSLTDPEGNATSWTYDSMGRVVSETNEKNAVRYYQYDDLGRLIQTTDRNGRIIQYEYDYLGRQTAEKWLDSNNAVIGSIEYTFDGNNNLLTVADSISGTDYEYRYDALNRCVYTKVDSDELNSPVEFTYAYNSSDLTVTETLTGLINGVVAPYYQNVYQFDVFGRLENITQTGTGLTAKSVEYFYNKLGQRTGATYKQNGAAVSESNWVYDVAGKVSSIQHKTASDAVFAEYGFTWDAGNRITEFETVDGTAEYTYDKTGQLTGADYDYITDELYTYDDNGNRTNAGYVTGENNETLSDGTYRYSYDNEGNRTEKFLWTDTNNDGIIDASEKTLVQTYNWDYRNRLESVTNYENGIAKEVMDYLYDYLNLMIERTVTDAATSILQSSEYNLYSNGQVVLEYDTTSSVDAVKSVNLWGANIDELVAVEQMAQSVNDNNVILWTYSDHLNSIRDVVLYDSIIQTATVVNHLIYNAFGILVSSTDGNSVNPASISPLLNFRYTGKFFDDFTGLQNNINRWYDNTTGKWLSVDPIGFYGDYTNLYRYTENNSIYYFDLLGLDTDNINFSFDSDKISESLINSLVQDHLAFKDDKTGNVVLIDSFGSEVRALYLKRWNSCANFIKTGFHGEKFYYLANVKSIVSLDQLKSANVDVDQYISQIRSRSNQYIDLFKGIDDAAWKSRIADMTELVANFVPGYSTADNLMKGNYGEATISFAGDAAMLISGPLAKICQAKKLVKVGIAVETGIGVTRSAQAGIAFYNGDNEAAIGYLGEGAMRLMGAGAIYKNYLQRTCFIADTQVVIGINNPPIYIAANNTSSDFSTWINKCIIAGIGIYMIGISRFLKRCQNQTNDFHKTISRYEVLMQPVNPQCKYQFMLSIQNNIVSFNYSYSISAN